MPGWCLGCLRFFSKPVREQMRKGTGATCYKCPVDTFKENFSDTSDECTPCPFGSTAEEGSASPSSCICSPGRLYWKDGKWTLCHTPVQFLFAKLGEWRVCSVFLLRRCGCRVHEAFDSRASDGAFCVPCSHRNLECPTEGYDMQMAKPKAGFFPLLNQGRAVLCSEPDRCIPEPNDPHAICQSGYTGRMCMDCAERFYATANSCEKCVDAEIPHAMLLLLVVTWRTSS